MKEKVPEVMAIVEPKPAPLATAGKAAIDRIREVEDRLLSKSLQQIERALDWDSLNGDEREPPPGWTPEQFRVARAAMMSAKDAPVGLKMAQNIAIGIVKARATEKAAPRNLNIQIANMDFKLPDFPKLKVDK